MPKIVLKTKVDGHYKDVFARFDRDLFEALKPIGVKLDIVEFSGSQKGDRVHLKFGWPANVEWISDIVEDGATHDEMYFVDEGTKLPWPLKDWHHRHVVRHRDDQSCYIIDEMTYNTANALLSRLIYPALYLAFYPRKAQYRDYFAK